MYQRDYILRLIEQLAQILIVLRNRILGRQGDPAMLRMEIRTVAAQAGLDLDVAKVVDLTTLRMLVSLAGNIDAGRCWLLAELLYLEGLQAHKAGDRDQARRDVERARELHSWLEPEWKPFDELPAVGARMEEMSTLLTSIEDSGGVETKRSSGGP
jgi:hypothetical protein